MSAKVPAKGHSSKHVHKHVKHHKAKGKHHPRHHPKPATGTGHNVHTVAHHPKQAKPRGFAVDGLPVCAAEALAMSLRLAGQFVHDDDVAGLWDLTGASPLGASLAATLDAASLHGLAGCRPQAQRLPSRVPVHAQNHLALPFAQDEAVPGGPFKDFLAGDFHDLILGAGLAGCRPGTGWHEASEVTAVGHPAVEDLFCDHVLGDVRGDVPELTDGFGISGDYLLGRDAAQFHPFASFAANPVHVHTLILGVSSPGPHCVLATPGGWWSWGKLHDPWPCRIEEAWAVSWDG